MILGINQATPMRVLASNLTQTGKYPHPCLHETYNPLSNASHAPLNLDTVSSDRVATRIYTSDTLQTSVRCDSDRNITLTSCVLNRASGWLYYRPKRLVFGDGCNCGSIRGKRSDSCQASSCRTQNAGCACSGSNRGQLVHASGCTQVRPRLYDLQARAASRCTPASYQPCCHAEAALTRCLHQHMRAWRAVSAHACSYLQLQCHR
jgi:hypothetical protein